jgi:hypothetical protein
VLLRRALFACIGLLVIGQALIWWRALAWYPHLPDKIPMHFNGSGLPDRWDDRGPAWFLLPGMSTALLVLFTLISHFIGYMVVRMPMLVNMPNKELFVRLSPVGRLRVVAPTRVFLLWTMMTFLFAYIVDGSARVAIKEADTLPWWPMLLFMGGIFGGLVPFLLLTSRLIGQVAREEGVLVR